jgi:hypothetical protein
MNEYLILPAIGFGVAVYCGIRYAKNKSLIPLWVGLFFATISIIGLVVIISGKW